MICPRYRIGVSLAQVLLLWPATASANFLWPPLLYVYTNALWWVVIPGLFIEGVVYFFAWRRGWRSTILLTIGVNMASAVAGAVFASGSLLFLSIPLLSLGFVRTWPLFVFAVTVAAEYWAGVRFFSLPRAWRTVAVIGVANVPSVALSIYGALQLVKGGA